MILEGVSNFGNLIRDSQPSFTPNRANPCFLPSVQTSFSQKAWITKRSYTTNSGKSWLWSQRGPAILTESLGYFRVWSHLRKTLTGVSRMIATCLKSWVKNWERFLMLCHRISSFSFRLNKMASCNLRGIIMSLGSKSRLISHFWCQVALLALLSVAINLPWWCPTLCKIPNSVRK